MSAELTRRTFVQLVGAGLAACSSRPARDILPYGNQPPEVTPGVASHYATALVEDGFATGVIVEAHEGRPTKLEGNPDHPASGGGTRAIEQAAALSLYDPQRITQMTAGGAPVAWSAIERLLRNAGAGLRVLMEPSASPLVAERVAALRARGVQVVTWSPFGIGASVDGNRLAFGRPLHTQLDLAQADVIVTLGADVVASEPRSLVHARAIASRRQVVDASSQMTRIYAVETQYSCTGVIADHRFAVRPSDIAVVAAELLASLGHGRRSARSWVRAVARDVERAGPRAVVIAGQRQPAVVHAIAAAVNARLRSAAAAYTEPVLVDAGDLSQLIRDLEAGNVHTLVVIGGDPVTTLPQLATSIARVEQSVYCGVIGNPTASACRNVVPGLHDLERWGIERAYDGSITPIQPLIEPIYDGRSIEDILDAMLGAVHTTSRKRVVEAWSRYSPQIGFEQALVKGVVDDTSLPHEHVELRPGEVDAAIAQVDVTTGIELQVLPHPFVHDGRYATNPWLMELPEPITKLTWEIAAQLSTRTAARLGVGTGDTLGITRAGRSHAVSVVIVPGHADDAITLHAGIDRDVYALYPGGVVDVAPGDGGHDLAITQGHWSLEDRPIVLSSSLQALDTLHVPRGKPASLYAEVASEGPQWAMQIDLTTCTGCSACVMACAAENNTPVVGRDQVMNSREMHWLRIDRYIVSDDNHHEAIAVQPMACQHCEKAPCEYVCPVEATTHSPDGLNEMAYNRCVGTRFCSNNCPYKVRRFNWFDFKEHKGLRVLGRNPDVTVRDRGVMEKCTYCVQRIRRAEIDARVHGDDKIGQVLTACQQACPSQAITFGSLDDRDARVVEMRSRPHSYAVLHDQGAEPRTRYLARIRNPNPELA